MLEVLAINFDQCTKFKSYLLSTSSRQLIHNVADSFWGSGWNGKGKHIQSKLMMQFRQNMSLSGTTITTSHVANTSPVANTPVVNTSPDTNISKVVNTCTVLIGAGVIVYAVTDQLHQSDIMRILSNPDTSRISDRSNSFTRYDIISESAA